MDILAFLLGGSFGLIVANLSLLLEQIQQEGLTSETMADLLHEIGVILFLFALLGVYNEL